ncbi:hypothetical protein [uncultured Devosia sp.]|uniref:hypothetical protein n=1 Tax=uncultured Devosia sp. TaxID=211434 RepID=UPI0035CC9913
MLIENIMYFALGLLAAGLLALIIMPAVWRRAVRLTKRRIEAATPITMAEFRADKDQLRAQFALSTRRLEMSVETLRTRLAEQLSDADRKRTELGVLTAERSQQVDVVRQVEEREVALRSRVSELEREGTELARRLDMAEREMAARASEHNPADPLPAGKPSLPALETNILVAAEARFASAETRLNAILAETGELEQKSGGSPSRLLADQLNRDDDLDALRASVAGVEATILADWGTDRTAEEPLRDRLNDIASGVSRLVYAVDTEPPVVAAPEESLFDRVQRFADEGESTGPLSKALPRGRRKGGNITDRMAALREIQSR